MGLKLIDFLRRNARQINFSFRSLILVVVAAAISGTSNIMLISLINRVLVHGPAFSTRLLFLFGAMCALSAGSRVASESLLIRVSQHTSLAMRMHLSGRILSAPLRNLEELGAHRLLVMLTNDIATITGALAFLPGQCVNAVIVIGGMIYLGILSWAGFLLVLCVLIIGMFTYRLIARTALSRLKLARSDEEVMFGHFRSLTQGIKELKLHSGRRKAFVSDVLGKAATVYNEHSTAGSTRYRIAAAWAQVLWFLLVGLLLFTVPAAHIIQPAILVSFVLTVMYIMGPLSGVMTTLPAFGRADIAVQKIEQVSRSLATEESQSDPQETSRPQRRLETLELLNIEHTYRKDVEDGDFILGPINLMFFAGELVFLTGGNGSGKTTLAKVLVGLYAPQGGEIYLSGKPVTPSDGENYKQLFSVVFSDFHLFDSLLGTTGGASADLKAREYLRTLQLEHKLTIEDGVFSTTALSQGQRKRLALLTAFMEDREFCVFDEWAADQDRHFKEIFYLQLLPELKRRGKTVLVISHDESYYGCADRIIRLENGQVKMDTRMSISVN